ncbi:BNR-4 repeat-containing protein [Marinoscillum sp. MHG1-6]|uniref:BNR-4 repeat-containing protein n=1 Tax=Marinoscillum sp. MHG1-6 TaxID=2959627 RepID=UPI002158595D|nr:BNR-4 repeat-containing protein [Marinoscillum sp. MHG1-6]
MKHLLPDWGMGTFSFKSFKMTVLSKCLLMLLVCCWSLQMASAQVTPTSTQLMVYSPDGLSGRPDMAKHNDDMYIVYTEGKKHWGEVVKYNLTTGATVYGTRLFPTIGKNDASHNDATIAVDGDGYIHVMIGMHNDKMKYYKSDNPEDPTSFTNLSTSMPGYNDTGMYEKQYTYPDAATASNGDVIFVLRRNGLGTDGNSKQHYEKQDLYHYDLSTGQWSMVWIKGKDADASGELYRNAYMSRIFADDNNNIHIGTVWSWYHNGNNTFQRGTYLKYDVSTGNCYKADGTDVTAQLPIYVDDTDGSVDFFFNSGEPWGKIKLELQTPHVTLNDLGHPVMSFARNWEPSLSKGADDRDPGLPDPIMKRTISYWDGSSWNLVDSLSEETAGGRPLISNTAGQLNTYSRDLATTRYIVSSTDNGVTWGSEFDDGGTGWLPALVKVSPNKDLVLASHRLFEFTYETSGPIADFSANITSVEEGGSITFTDQSSGSPTSWAWTFTGGTPSSSTAQNPVIVYNTAGTYEVALTVTNAEGSDVETKTGYITVTVPGSNPPVADFSADVTSVVEGGSVSFTDLSTNSPTSWDWTFTGGSPASSTSQNPVIVYNAEGTYTVQLTATNADGSDGETKVSYITVTAAGGGGCTVYNTEGFESGWGIWYDGGSNCDLVNNPAMAATGNYCVDIKNGNGSSYTRTTDQDLSAYASAEFSLSFITDGLSTGESFTVNVSNNSGADWTLMKRYVEGTDFTDGVRVNDVLTTSGITLTANSRFKIIGEMNSKNDHVFLDDLEIRGCASGGARMSSMTTVVSSELDVQLYPNPAHNLMNVQINKVLDVNSTQVMVYNIMGAKMSNYNVSFDADVLKLDVSQLPQGVYLISLILGDERIDKRFVVK